MWRAGATDRSGGLGMGGGIYGTLYLRGSRTRVVPIAVDFRAECMSCVRVGGAHAWGDLCNAVVSLNVFWFAAPKKSRDSFLSGYLGVGSNFAVGDCYG